jgi:2-oxoglutarate ferredoxin oxidoreductase subunit delta
LFLGVKAEVKIMVTILIDEEWCRGCYLCVHFCAKKVLSRSRRRNPKGYTLPELTALEKCTGCESCEFICPELAITVEKEGQE